MGRPFGSYTQKSNTPKQSQGRSILESLDPMPAFTNRARRQATVLRKHPSGKFHLIITGNCVIGWKVGHNTKNSRTLGECYWWETAGAIRQVLLDLIQMSSLFPSHPQLSKAKLVGLSSLVLQHFGAPDTHTASRSVSSNRLYVVWGRNHIYWLDPWLLAGSTYGRHTVRAVKWLSPLPEGTSPSDFKGIRVTSWDLEE